MAESHTSLPGVLRRLELLSGLSCVAGLVLFVTFTWATLALGDLGEVAWLAMVPLLAFILGASLLDSGMDACVVKPVALAQLREVVAARLPPSWSPVSQGVPASAVQRNVTGFCHTGTQRRPSVHTTPAHGSG